MSHARRWIAAWVLCLPTLSFAQGTAGISGTVKDATGAVLPGVTVEATSSALIEKVRTVVSDGSGQYKIVSLPPGPYSVTFTLAGFNAFRRDGIDLTTGFTATVNAELRVGALEETVLVSGQAAVVDIQNVKRQEVMTRDIVDALPTGKALVEIATLVPGVQMINGSTPGTGMGGSAGMDQFATLAAHGSRSNDTKLEVNGINVNIFGNRPDSTYVNFADGNVQEYTVEVSGHSAESETGGVRVNIIPKEGGNRFSGSVFANFANDRFQADNMTDALRASGLRDPDKTKSLWTVNPSLGGPLVKDKLWFYGGYSRMVNRRYKAGIYYTVDPAAWRPEFDFTRQAVAGDQTHDSNIRLTWQAASKHKLSFFYDYNDLCQCPYLIGATYIGIALPDASGNSPRWSQLRQGNWTAPLTSRILLEAAVSLPTFEKGGADDRFYLVTPKEPRITEASNGWNYRAPSIPFFSDYNTNNVYKGSVSYVTGSHAVKVGGNYQSGISDQTTVTFQNITYATLNFRPTSVTYYAHPFQAVSEMTQGGAFAQDQWKINRLTLNMGLRFDYYSVGYPDHHMPPTQDSPTPRDFAGATVVRWRDLQPRVGVAFDLFGSGRTAVKASLGRYSVTQTLSVISNVHPARANNSVARQWTDPNGDFIVQGDPLNPAANGELGASQNLNFGRPIISNRYDPDFWSGFGVSPYNWEGTASMQHEIFKGVSLNAAYHRRWFGNFQVTDNLLVGPGDFDPYCVTAPVDARLPGDASGQQICGLYDLVPARRGLSDNVYTSSSNYGDQYEHWNGGDISLQARLGRGLLLNGGVSTGRTTTDNCDVVTKLENPSTRFCHLETPYLTQIKFGGSYTLPFDVQVSGTLQSFQGPPLQANATFTNAQIAPSLGRNLTSGATATITLLPGSGGNTITGAQYFGDRLSQVDLRVAKNLRFGGVRVKGMVDIFNLMNINTVTLLNYNYGTTGSSWLTPTGISLARLIKIGAQVDF